MSATLTLAGTVLGLPEGTFSVGPLTAFSAAPVGSIMNLTPAAGDNPVLIPAGTTAILITLPAGNLVPVKIKGQPADAGLALNKAGWMLYQPDPAQNLLLLNAASAISQAVEILFI